MRNASRSGAIPAAILLLVCAVASSQAADSITSEYTKTIKGTVLAQSGPKDEMAWSSIRYKGLGGYDLIVHDDDDRSWIDLEYGGKTVDLRRQTFERAPGSFPNKANNVVEWRGLARKGEFVPFAMIYRVEVTDEETRRSKSYLVVIHLDKLRSRVVGLAQGKEEDADAKKIADRYKP
ncbi:MAG TPA: hypothetical protein VGO11_00155 [Chthoniobacteraceae bacterium]|jgi:hypothetical protein|nr:hypothetical protein [Chthoniobacteraceae bacterium]